MERIPINTGKALVHQPREVDSFSNPSVPINPMETKIQRYVMGIIIYIECCGTKVIAG